MQNGIMRLSAHVVFVVLWTVSAWAFPLPGGRRGRGATTTEDGNAEMVLGEYRGLKHAVGCVDFQNQAGWSGQWNLGQNLSIMLESALMDTGRFVLVEREKLSHIIAEQDLAAGGRTAQARKVAQTGVLRPARYIATGAVTEVTEGRSGQTGGVSFRGITMGGGRSTAQVTIIAKLIDTTTGEIVAQKRVVGTADRTSMNVGVRFRGVQTSMGGFQETPLGEAAQDCMNHAAIFFARTMEEFPFEGSVVRSDEKRVIVNRGAEYGLAPGTVLVMRTEGEMLIDPDTGAVLGEEKGETIGRLRVTEVQEKFAYCEVIEGDKLPPTGTTVFSE